MVFKYSFFFLSFSERRGNTLSFKGFLRESLLFLIKCKINLHSFYIPFLCVIFWETHFNASEIEKSVISDLLPHLSVMFWSFLRHHHGKIFVSFTNFYLYFKKEWCLKVIYLFLDLNSKNYEWYKITWHLILSPLCLGNLYLNT